MKKIIGLMFGVMLSLYVMAAEWYDETTGFTWYYTISGDSATLTGCSPKEGNLPPLPSELGGKPVKRIDYSAFSGCNGLTGTLHIPNSVTEIMNGAFEGCFGLKGPLIIPDSVINVDSGAFKGCKGFSGQLKLSNNLLSIGSYAFQDCSGFSGSLIIPDKVAVIYKYAFAYCSGFDGDLIIGAKVQYIYECAFYYCSGFSGSIILGESLKSIDTRVGYVFTKCDNASTIIANCEPPIGFKNNLWGKSISYLPENGAAWQKLLRDNNGLVYDAGYIRSNAQSVSIVSSRIRETDPTVMDVVYKVTSSQPTVKVRALAFKDGVRSFANVVRPETFIEGTDANIGDGIAANVEHKLSWKVSADWQETLAKVKFEVLALDGELLPLELTTLPKTDAQPKMEVSWNVMFDSWVFDALMWLYADKDLGLTLKDGVLRNGEERIAEGEKMSGTGYSAIVYVYGKMGYVLLQGERLEYARQMLRRNLPDVSQAQYAVKVIEE